MACSNNFLYSSYTGASHINCTVIAASSSQGLADGEDRDPHSNTVDDGAPQGPELQRGLPATALPCVIALSAGSNPNPQAPTDGSQSYVTSPMLCRSMDLLGFVRQGSTAVQFCVHQVSMELWNMFDTPRVSVQKKILHLGIQLSNGTKEQISLLRKAGVVEGFRATMIGSRDTERLFDALEQSRKKRGIAKHALKANCDPKERALRVEEIRARRLGALVRYQSSLAPDSAARCALNENAALFAQLFSVTDEAHEFPLVGIGQLLVAGDAEELYTAHRHSIETIDNRPVPTGELTLSSQARANDPHPLLAHPMDQRPLQLPISACGSLLDSPKSPSSQYLLPTSPPLPSNSISHLSSPGLESSEFEEQSSTYSYNSQTRSCTASPQRCSCTPERFLFLDSDSEDDEAEGSPPVENQAEVLLLQEDENKSPEVDKSALAERHVQHRTKPAPLKLLHLALASSPPNPIVKTLVPLPTSSALLVSIPLSMLRISSGDDTSPVQASGCGTKETQRRRRGVALSSFAMKKRAEDPPSFSALSSSEGGITFESGLGVPPPVIPVGRGRGRPRGSRGRGGGRGKKRSTLPIPLSSATKQRKKTDSRKDKGNEAKPGSPVTSLGEIPRFKTAVDSFGTQEDDQLSLASSSTASIFSTKAAPTSSRGSSRQPRIVPPGSEKQPFSLESLFGFCGPPKLVVRNGELVPEQSLSTKGLDCHAIPENHPVFSWSLGQPVKGTGAAVSKRRKKKQQMEETALS